MILAILLVLLVLFLLGGGFSHPRYGVWGFSPALIIAIVLIVFLLARGGVW